jgi:hypothetical protein
MFRKRGKTQVYEHTRETQITWPKTAVPLLCSCDKAVEPTVSFRDLNKNDDKGHVADRASLRRDPIARMLEWSAK